MTDEDIDRALTGGRLAPSSRFEASVMEAVHRGVVAPPPLVFPWIRALPGMVAFLAACGLAIWTYARVY